MRHGVVALTFADGLRAELDVLARMREPVFSEAAHFARAIVDPETGTIVWPG